MVQVLKKGQEKIELIDSAVKNFSMAYIAHLAGADRAEIDKLRSFPKDDTSGKRKNPFEELNTPVKDAPYQEADFQRVFDKYPQLSPLKQLREPIILIAREIDNIKQNGAGINTAKSDLFKKFSFSDEEITAIKKGYSGFIKETPCQKNPSSPQCIQPNAVYDLIAKIKNVQKNEDLKFNPLRALNSDLFHHSSTEKGFSIGNIFKGVREFVGSFKGTSCSNGNKSTHYAATSISPKQREVTVNGVYNFIIAHEDSKGFFERLKKYDMSHQEFLDRLLCEPTPAISLVNVRYVIEPIMKGQKFQRTVGNDEQELNNFKETFRKHVVKLEEHFMSDYNETDISEKTLFKRAREELNLIHQHEKTPADKNNNQGVAAAEKVVKNHIKEEEKKAENQKAPPSAIADLVSSLKVHAEKRENTL